MDRFEKNMKAIRILNGMLLVVSIIMVITKPSYVGYALVGYFFGVVVCQAIDIPFAISQSKTIKELFGMIKRLLNQNKELVELTESKPKRRKKK